ncbi:MAG: hypothetical protein LDL25_06850 [Hyphomicrobiales bacterium]|uniref:hypothetical protein n=1 Tax=Rhabdaerophilum calidifontis TaxID=2604328 RepID=UPI00140CCAE1|nr:hypothetical protein [Rhabdaerophilum calidifontis]MCA1999490.1 hypothetical protein [Hyphomicrobiales bacterium]
MAERPRTAIALAWNAPWFPDLATPMAQHLEHGRVALAMQHSARTGEAVRLAP